MDSGNSGSMQSSSGGDEEYDSRADSLSAFLNTPGAGLAALSHHPTRVPTTSLHHHHHPPPLAAASSPSLFDPISVYFDGLARSPPALPSSSSPIRNFDMPWPRGIGASDPPSCTDVVSLMASASIPSDTANTTLPILMGANRDLYSGGGGISPLTSSSLPTLQQPSSAPPPHNAATAPAAAAAAAPPRSSKKRSRASRRASTTVLTTDTSNFRAMVQEFTGLPAPPFSPSPFPRARFDLLHAAASSVMRSSAMSDGSPHYLLRPFAQRLPVLSSVPFSLGSSSSAPSFAPSAVTGTVGSTTNVTTAPANATTIAATSISTTTAFANRNTTSITTASAAITTNTASTSSYQLPSDLGLETQHQSSLPNMFSCPSLVQPFPSMKYSSANVPPIVGDKKATPGAAAASPLGAAMADYIVVGGLRHGHADAHLGTMQSPTEPTAGMMPSQGGGGAAGDDLLRWVEGPAGGSDQGDQGQFRPAGGSCSSSQRGSSCKLNYAGSASSDYHAEKGAENVSARGEGMVESWICSSD